MGQVWIDFWRLNLLQWRKSCRCGCVCDKSDAFLLCLALKGLLVLSSLAVNVGDCPKGDISRDCFYQEGRKEKGDSLPLSCEDVSFNSYKAEWLGSTSALLAELSKAVTLVLRHNKLRFPSGSLSQLVSGQVPGNVRSMPSGTLRHTSSPPRDMGMLLLSSSELLSETGASWEVQAC